SRFLRSKKHVLVEKPLALRSREADELVRLAETNRKVLAVGHVHRFNNGVKELKRVIDSGLLGDIYYLRLQWTGFLPPQRDRDVTVVGSDAVARLDCLDQKLILQRSDKTETISTVPSNTLHEEIIHFAECVENNSTSEPYSNLSDGAIGAGVVRLLEASKRSVSEERTIQVSIPESEELIASEPAQTGFRKLSAYHRQLDNSGLW